MRSLIQAIEATDHCILACVQFGSAESPRLLWGATTVEGQEWSAFCHYDSASEALLGFGAPPVTQILRFESDMLAGIEASVASASRRAAFVCEWIASGRSAGWHRPLVGPSHRLHVWEQDAPVA